MKDNVHVLYLQKEKNAKRLYRYTKSRKFAKIKSICVTFLFTKIQTLYVTQFL